MTALSYQTTRCPECCGEGTILEPRSVAGEYLDADYIEVECSSCEGTGEIDSACAECSRVAPLDGEGFCASCTFPVEHLVDEPLSEVRSPEGWQHAA
jgi:RecJ-like exonuclease